jgi:hypothetical protein
MPHRHRIFSVLLALALLGGPAAVFAGQPAHTHTRTIDKSEAVTASTRISVENLVGHVEVTQGGDKLKVHATVVAGGADAAAARKLADTIKLAVKRDGDKLAIHVDYPLASHDSYRYIPTDGESDHHGVSFLGMHFGGRSHSSLRYQGHDVDVYRGGDEGVPLHVDLAVKLPRGTHASIDNRVGLITASHLDNVLVLKSDSGDIHADTVSGKLKAISNAGDIEVRHIAGKAELHTNAGDITGQHVHVKRLAARTASGDIDLKDMDGEMKINTGNGDIDLRGMSQVPHLTAHTGNGDIKIKGDLSGLRDFDLASGHGDIRLVTGQFPPVHLDIETGMGDIDVNWPDIANVKRTRHHYTGDVGDASGDGRIQTGMGDVTLAQ